MHKGFEIKPIETKYDSARIKPSSWKSTEKVSFNFKCLCEKGKKFIYKKENSKYFIKLLDQLKKISEMTKKEMVIDNSRALRCHRIDFKNEKVSEDTFHVLGEDIDKDAWQFQVTSNEHGRVHGFFVLNTFYIVWLDPDHQLYNEK